MTCVALFGSAQAGAHARSASWSSIFLDGREARIVLRVAQLELTRLPFGTVSPGRLLPDLADYASRRLQLRVGEAPCPLVSPPRALRAPPERAVLSWRVACPPEGAITIESAFLLDVAPSHMHFARLRLDGALPTERVLTEEDPAWTLASGEPEGSSLLRYLRLGIVHIVGGADHLVFLLGLLLLAGRLREVVTIATGFTVAHSITLALAALGRVQPESAAVEAIIGLSIALVAAENAWLLAGRPRALPAAVAGLLALMGIAAAFGVGGVPAVTLLGLSLFVLCYLALVDRSARPARLRFAIAFAFGLVHGFGFAGVLTELALPGERLLPALLGFNLGVEIGQLAMVALAWPLLRGLGRLGGRTERWVLEGTTAAVAGLGVFWLVSRAY